MDTGRYGNDGESNNKSDDEGGDEGGDEVHVPRNPMIRSQKL